MAIIEAINFCTEVIIPLVECDCTGQCMQNKTHLLGISKLVELNSLQILGAFPGQLSPEMVEKLIGSFLRRNLKSVFLYPNATVNSPNATPHRKNATVLPTAQNVMKAKNLHCVCDQSSNRFFVGLPKRKKSEMI